MVGDLADYDGTFDASILGDLADRCLQRPADDADPGLLVFIVAFDLQRLRRPKQRNAATGHDALLDRSAGRVQRVVDTVFPLLHLDFT